MSEVSEMVENLVWVEKIPIWLGGFKMCVCKPVIPR